jgi:hypothetical protein
MYPPEEIGPPRRDYCLVLFAVTTITKTHNTRTNDCHVLFYPTPVATDQARATKATPRAIRIPCLGARWRWAVGRWKLLIDAFLCSRLRLRTCFLHG